MVDNNKAEQRQPVPAPPIIPLRGEIGEYAYEASSTGYTVSIKRRDVHQVTSPGDPISNAQRAREWIQQNSIP